MKRLLLTLVLSAAVLAPGTTQPPPPLPAAPAPPLGLLHTLQLVPAAAAYQHARREPNLTHATQPPRYAAGTGWQYSNTNYNLAGMINERITHRSLAGEVHRRVIDRLRLRDTSFPPDEPTLPRPAA